MWILILTIFGDAAPTIKSNYNYWKLHGDIILYDKCRSPLPLGLINMRLQRAMNVFVNVTQVYEQKQTTSSTVFKYRE
jgi:hypothetical protein